MDFFHGNGRGAEPGSAGGCSSILFYVRHDDHDEDLIITVVLSLPGH